MSALHAPRRLLLTLKLGEVPDHLPSLREVRQEGRPMAQRIDGGVIDRLLAHHGGAARAVRLHSARVTRLQRPGVPGARRFDDIEQLSGVARVLRIELAQDAYLDALVQALAQVTRVDQVQPDRLCVTPSDARRSQRMAELDPVAARRPRALVRLPQALALQRGDPSVVVGLADTGVALRHVELASRLRRGFDTVDLDAATVGDLTLVGDNAGRDEQPDDEVGHGSACAGILRANGTGLPAGGAGLCGLTPVRVLGAALQGDKRVGIGALANIDAGAGRAMADFVVGLLVTAGVVAHQGEVADGGGVQVHGVEAAPEAACQFDMARRHAGVGQADHHGRIAALQRQRLRQPHQGTRPASGDRIERRRALRVTRVERRRAQAVGLHLLDAGHLRQCLHQRLHVRVLRQLDAQHAGHAAQLLGVVEAPRPRHARPLQPRHAGAVQPHRARRRTGRARGRVA